jgi:micrococcal nuclease
MGFDLRQLLSGFLAWFCLAATYPPDRYDYCERVETVLDGDSFRTSSREIRLLGIDAPELGQEPHGPRSKRHLLELLEAADTPEVCCLEGQEPVDAYDRRLAYCWQGDKFLNASMLREGMAVTLFYGDRNRRYRRTLLELERQAEASHVGIHDPGQPLEMSPFQWRRLYGR